MKNFLFFTLSFLATASFSQKKNSSKSEAYSAQNKSVVVDTSADSTSLRLSKTNSDLKFVELKQPLETQVCIFVNPDKKFQTFMGIGGAITDASAEVFAKLPPYKQSEFIEAYYSKEKGIGYSLIRTNMSSCDFSSDMYDYIKEGDKSLNSFSIEHDKKFKIPLIQKALQSIGKEASLYISPWSPPAFMKDNNSKLQGGKLLPEYHQSWANYYVNYINALQKEGIPVWGLTIQNEPMAKQRWESCIFSAEEERDFLKNYLGPTLEKSGLGSKKIIIWDHNRDLISQRVSTILSDAVASKYVWGIGFHWYENWSGGEMMFDNIGKVNEMYPNKNLLFTEGCVERFNPSNYQLWKNGERYGKSMINDFNNGTVGWTDWNVLLDQNGGPNHVGNFCFATIHGNLETGELIYTPSYYFIGHFSKFINKGAKRISSSASRSQLLTTSFLNPDGKVVTVVMNQSNATITYNLCVGNRASEVTILPHAIQTLVY
jgi:glucosylceramidase